ncbi:hypothetical protein H0H81_005239, partial [Sphagnurus paluster]
MNHGFDFDSFSGHSTSLSPSDSGFNSSGLSLPPDIYTTSYSRAVELLNVAELMRNPHYMELHKKYDALRDQVMNLHGQIGKLNQRNTELMERAHRAELQGTKIGDRHSRSSSLAPSDSISRNHTPDSQKRPQQPVNRPQQYPASILWTWEECKADSRAIPDPNNPSRPLMEQALRNDDGTEITSEEWRNVLASARSILIAVLQPLALPSTLPKDTNRTRSFYRDHYPAKWNDALLRLETAAPILRTCGDHWKADHTLRIVLNSKNTSSRKRRKNGHHSDDDLNPPSTNRAATNTTGSKARPKPHSTTNPALSAKPASPEGAVSSASPPVPSANPPASSSNTPISLTNPPAPPSIPISSFNTPAPPSNLDLATNLPVALENPASCF